MKGAIMKHSRIVITDIDRRRLGTLADRAARAGAADRRAIADLECELELAEAVDPADCPSDVVTMNSTIRLHDLDRDQVETFTLVYPGRADRASKRVSVLSRLGTAIFGARVGDVIEYELPHASVRLRVIDLLYQPERAGEWDCEPAASLL
jgi:regulator of nucleoside diphosphate kinase